MKDRDLVIYHPGTGTVIPLSDEVYVIDTARLSDEERSELEEGWMSGADAYAIGIRLDNFNMTNIFFESALVHGWDGDLVRVRITDIDEVCMVCGSADGEPCAKA